MSQKDEIQLSLFDVTNRTDKTFSGRNRELLFSIDTLLKEQNSSKEKIQGIFVVVGSGGFTSTRIAVTVANTFGYALHIPLMTITEDNIDSVQEIIPMLNQQPPGQLLRAMYSGEPNIGK